MGELKVIGAGFGRTGTLSLKRALEELGFGRVYHGENLLRNPVHYYRWRQVYRTGRTDWDRLFRRYNAAIDYPTCCVWKDLAAHYPEAKIILTVRDPQKWWKSTADTLYKARRMTPTWWQVGIPTGRAFVEVNEGFIWDGLFDGRFTDRDHAMKVFEAHRADVEATADPDRLLVYNVTEGWGPLCEFLGVPEPSHPFPHVNDSAKYQRVVRIASVVTRVVPPVAAGVVALAIWRWITSTGADTIAGS